MKKFAKIGALFMSFVLVIVATVGITLAYLTKTTGAVTNTFVARSGLLAQGQDFVLNESPVKLSTDGNAYEKADGARVTENDYEDLLAGMTLYKDPAVNLGKLIASSYMFVEIVENINFTLTYAVTGSWTELADVTGDNGGKVYVYKIGSDNVIPVTGEGSAVGSVEILVDNTVTVGNFNAENVQNSTLTFYGYLCQTAGFTDAKDAYTKCFLA